MDTPIKIALLITALPLAAFAIQLLSAFFTRRLPSWSSQLSTAAMFGSLGLSLYLLATQVLAHDHGIEHAFQWSTSWISLGEQSPLRVDFSVLVDNLTIVMLCVVTGVSALVHLYSSSYMHGEKRYTRFFAYLSLFTFSMLGLVIASNILILFIFWELVGVCSYFLIGFFIEKKSAGDASKKAFVTNRVGDACFMTAICLTFAALSKVTPGADVLGFPAIYHSIGQLATGAGPWAGQTTLLTVVGLLFFMGCVTKSAQFPLHIWLPDAMEGPTPVSALIHAATMVAAGVYMIVRMFPVLCGEGYLSGHWFDSPALLTVALIGGFTSLFAGTIALVQGDLKKGLAYSTVSQLGYMSMAVGVGCTTGGMFHLFTHAFFKACLFLGAGSVIHAVHSQNMIDMGGLRRKMPVTFWTFLLATLAIAGTPFTSGFLSKEMVLTSALAFGHLHAGSTLHMLPFLMAAATAVLTCFYMFRMVFLTFFGRGAWEDKPHGAHDDHAAHAPHAAPTAAVAAPGAHDPHAAHGHAAVAHDPHDAHGHAAPAAAHAAPDPHAAHDDHHGHGEPHESPWRMALPLAVLGTLAVISGGIGFPGAPGSSWFEHRVNDEVIVGSLMRHQGGEMARVFEGQVVHEVEAPLAEHTEGIVAQYHEAWHHAHGTVLAFSLCALIGGVGAAWFFFIKKRGHDFVRPVALLRGLRSMMANLWYVDAFFMKVCVPACGWLMYALFAFDKHVVDGLVNAAAAVTGGIAWVSGRVDYHGVDGAVRGTGAAVLEAGDMVRSLVTGRIQDYVKFTVVGLAVLLVVVAACAR